MSIVVTKTKICDACDMPIKTGDLAVFYSLALGAQIDLHKACADQQPQNGFNSEMARKARVRQS